MKAALLSNTRDLEIVSRGLEDAFLSLTGSDDDVAAPTTEGAPA